MDTSHSTDEILKKVFKEMDKRQELEASQKTITKETIPLYLKRKIENNNWNFKTFKDPVLIKLLEICKSFCNDLSIKKYRWVTLSGPTELGKTHLAKQVFKFIRDNEFDLSHKFNYPYVKLVRWSDMITKIFKGELALDTLENCGLLVIEDLLSYRTWGTQWQEGSLDTTYEILNSRLKKPTFIDTNKSHSEIMKLDARIGSRLLREGSVFYEIPPDTINYLSRC